MSTIWVVEHGEYSDYRVVGVFSSKKNAEMIASRIAETTVAEWPIDPCIDTVVAGMTVWHLAMERDGTTHDVKQQAFSVYDISRHSFLTFGEGVIRMGPFCDYAGKECMVGSIWAQDEQGAVKRANEIRAHAIAEGRWPEAAQE